MELSIFSYPKTSLWSTFRPLLRYLSETEQNRVERLYQERHKLAKLFSILFQKMILSQATNISYKQLAYEYNEHQKPFLSNCPLYFNLSNSGNYVAMAHDHFPIGIDIELERHIELEIANRFFSPEEIEVIHYDPFPLQRFFQFWTLKEAFLKCLGTGLTTPLSHFSVTKTSQEPFYTVTYQEKKYYLALYSLENKIPLSICSTTSFSPPSIKHFSLHELLSFFPLVNKL